MSSILKNGHVKVSPYILQLLYIPLGGSLALRLCLHLCCPGCFHDFLADSGQMDAGTWGQGVMFSLVQSLPLEGRPVSFNVGGCAVSVRV